MGGKGKPTKTSKAHQKVRLDDLKAISIEIHKKLFFSLQNRVFFMTQILLIKVS